MAASRWPPVGMASSRGPPVGMAVSRGPPVGMAASRGRQKSLLFSIFDSTTIFTSLGPLDEIADSSGFLEFSFQQPCPFLDVHFSTGQIRLGKYLNELNATLLVNCSVVIKSAVDSNSVIVNLLLKITPKAWQQIHFLQLKYNGSIAENSPIGSLVSGNINGSIHQNHQLQLCIHQPKLSSINERTLKYRILSPIEPFFAIDSSTGRIRSVAPMDFELNKHWSFYVVAQSVTADSSAALVYTLQPSLVTISTTNRTRNFSGGIIAKDEDTVGDLRYAIRQVKPASAQSLFSVDRINGEVFASSNDSSLFKSPNYKVNLIATDGLHTAHSALQIDLISPNHTKDIANTLQFPKDIYSISVPENLTFALNTELLSLWPSNADVNERFVFHLLNRHPSFIVDEQSGLLRLNLKYPLDREVTPKVQLMIKARSTLGNRRAYTSVHVEVEDINDCAPTFHQLPYTATISEEATVGDRVLSLKAKDNDLGMSGVVRYSLAADAPTFFQVNKYDGRVTIAALPPAKQLQLGSIFHFHVLATDKGNPALSSSTWVEVKVANKHQPSFSHSHYFAKISEAVSPGTYVISVRAYSNTDGVVGYRISEGDDLRHFAMDYNKGTITVNSQLDREQLDKYILKVEAVDVTRTGGGVHAAAAVAMVNIQVEDINDTPPQFQQPIYHFSVLESASLGSLLGEVKAEDPDHSSLANECMTIGYHRELLDKNIITGRFIWPALPGLSLDFENQRFYEYTIQVRDIDRLASEAILQLQILDVNDEAPLFSGIPQSPLQLNMMADSKNGDFIYKFHVEDRDTVATLANKAHKIEFQIAELENGRRLVKPLNVSATDGLFTIFIDVEVEIVPNAIAPLQFEQAFYSATINENRASTNKSSITIVKAKGGVFQCATPLLVPLKTTLLAVCSRAALRQSASQ
uniref:Cadherin domain-containing protein n=1 Tax=Ditylenchus dipsaci TaxID=166011 RepID=A0A915D9Z7_9BILA